MSCHSMSCSEKFTPSIFYLPCLHRELAPGLLPEEVYFLNPGLPVPPDTAKGGKIWTPPGLPYDLPSAARCLQDLIAEGENLGHDLLLTAGGADVRLATTTAAPLDSSESAALRAFTQTGDYAPQAHAGKSESASREAVCEQAQKLLLLCAHLEDNILAARGLTHKISAGEAVLQELLRGNDEREALEGMALQEATSTGDDLFGQYLARWGEIARAWRVFLPDDAAFYAADFSALPGLDANAAQPLPRAEAARLFPASLAAGWKFIVLTPEEIRGNVRLISGRGPQAA